MALEGDAGHVEHGGVGGGVDHISLRDFRAGPEGGAVAAVEQALGADRVEAQTLAPLSSGR
ncbi:MAG: hypothetical protein R2749_30480 [Acidimicrobiales bacterium]